MVQFQSQLHPVYIPNASHFVKFGVPPLLCNSTVVIVISYRLTASVLFDALAVIQRTVLKAIG